MPLYDILVCTLPHHMEEVISVHPAGTVGRPTNPDNPQEKGFVQIRNFELTEAEAKALPMPWYEGGLTEDEAMRPEMEYMEAMDKIRQPFLVTIGDETFVPTDRMAEYNAAVKAFMAKNPPPVRPKKLGKRRFLFPLSAIKAKVPSFDIAKATDLNQKYQPFEDDKTPIFSTSQPVNLFFDRHLASTGKTGFRFKDGVPEVLNGR